MLELAFLLFILTKNLFWGLGVLTFSAFCAYIGYCALYRNPYRFFSSFWLEEIASLYLYTSPIKHIYQRLRYGCSDHDAWDFDKYLLAMLPVGLNHLRDSDMVNLTEKEWNDILGGIKGYNHVYECMYEYDYGQCPYSHQKLEEDFEKAMELITKNFKGLWI
jgi:hypothetical protein